MDRVAGPISAGIRKIKAPRKSACHDLVTEFCRQQFSVPLNPLEVSRATVKQEEAGFFAVGADGNSFRILWFVHHHSDIPLHAENVDSEYVFGLAHGDIRHAQDFLGIFDALLPRNELRRLPALVSFSFHFDLPFVGYKEREELKEECSIRSLRSLRLGALLLYFSSFHLTKCSCRRIGSSIGR